MIGRTLGFYFAKRFLVNVFIVIFTMLLLVYMVDFVELLRRAGDAQGVKISTLAWLALLRTPSVLEQIISFGLLFAAMANFIMLSRRLEFVIARAAGISVWGFIFPAVFSVFLIGIFFVTYYSSFSADLKEKAQEIEAQIFRRVQVLSEKDSWMRQRSVDGEAILRASSVDKNGTHLINVTAYIIDQQQNLSERIEAAEAELKKGYWRFTQVRIISTDNEPVIYPSYLLATNLTPDQTRALMGRGELLSFWSLPAVIERLDLAGLDATRYRIAYHSLLARPVLFVAMVLLAASFTLKFLRSGGLAKMVLSGVVAGFVLYVLTQIARDFGQAGILPYHVAAWLSPILASAFGVLTLLKKEDG